MQRTRVSLLLALAIAVATPAALSAQDNWRHHLTANTITASVAVGFDFSSLGLAVYPGAEWTIADPKFGAVPVSFGAAARGRLGLSGTFTAGVGAFATAHLGLLGLPIPEVFQAIEWYLGLGLGIDFVPALGFGFAGLFGMNYFINPTFAVYLEEVSWRSGFDTTIGIRLKLS